MDQSDAAPHSQLMVIGSPGPWEHHFVDKHGESLVAITNAPRWRTEVAVGEAAGLHLNNSNQTPPLRADGVRLEDSSWAEMHYIQFALAAGLVLVTLGRLEIIELFPWIFVAVGLMAYILAAIFSGRYFVKGDFPEAERPGRGGGRRKREIDQGQRKRRSRRGG